MKDDLLEEDEIARRRDAAIRRALNTPPRPTKELIGKGKREAAKRKGQVRKASRTKS